MIKYCLFGVCHDRTLEAHILEVADCGFDLIVGFASTELLVEYRFHDPMQHHILVDIKKKTLARFAQKR